MSISQASKECPKQRQLQPRIINKSTKWIGMQDQLSQPITFHFSCLATQQMHAQHYSVICEKYFRHVMSTAASFPFISAAFLHGGQAALISPWHWTCSLSPHLGSTLTDSAKRLSTNSHASTLILQIYYIEYQRVALAFVEVDINAFFWGRQPEEIGLWVTIVKRNKCKQVRKAVICARYSIKEQVSKEEAMQNGEQSRLAQVKGQLRDKGKGSVVSRQACSHAIIFIIITAIMFKQGWGSPRSKAAEAQEESSILSPRNFIKLITSGIGELKNNLSTPSQANYQQFVATFAPYLQSFRQEIQKYNKARSRQQSTNSKHQQLQLELRINKIPAEYFEEPQRFRLELFRRSEGGKRQEELSEFLDEIELILFTRAGKYPEKSSIILQNMVMLEGETERSLQKVVQFRRQVKERLTVHSQRQLKVKRIQQKMQRMKRVLGYIQMIKKMKDLKDISCAAQKEGGNEQVLLRIRKNEIEQCASFTSLAPILTNLERYRQSVKQRLYKEFLKHIEAAINHLLLYNKEDWKTINVPSAIFVGQTAQNDLSHNNITVLDQSYFAFESNNANIVHKRKLADTEAIEQQNEQQGAQTIETQKMVRSWALIQQFDLYDEVEVNEQFVKLLMKHNIRFNQDMQEYISYLYESQVQERKVGCILKGPQTYASLRNKQKEEAKHQSLQNNQDNIQLSSEKISFMDMRLFLKITKFYFGLLKKVLSFINAPTQMEFLTNLRHKFAEFLQGNITYFTSLKKITHDLSVDDFLNYLQIINYWENEELDEITEFCQNLKAAKIEEYLTNVQKNLLIKQLKQAIEQSTYLPTPVSSDNYMTFHAVLSPKSQPQFDNEQINMSMTLQLAENRLQADRVEGGEQPKEEVILRLITNYVVYRGKAYKICDSFLELAKSIEKYVSIKEALPETAQNVEQKICEIIGFYAWYNQKQIGNTKKAIRTLSNHCTFYSTLLLLKCVLHSLSITSKKLEKTKIQLNECQNQLHKSITMTPFLQIQQKISQLYESKISTRVQAPTGQSVKILEILKTSIDCLLEFFPIQYEQKIHESFIYRFMQNTVKIIYKNYFGYLVNMEKRGIAEVKWFLPKIKEILRITTINTAALVNRKGELLCKHGTLTFFLFNQEIQEMERILSQKAALKH